MTRTVIKPREKSERNFKWILIILCAAAEATNIYLAYEYLTFNFNSCSINQGWWSWLNCGTVGKSGYTSLFGIQFWAMGLVWFPLVLLVGLFLSKQVLLLLLVVGDMSTIYFWYLEIAVIHAVCPVCLALYIFNYVLTALTARQLFGKQLSNID